MPSPELLRCRVPDSIAFTFGGPVGGSGFLYCTGDDGSATPDLGYIVTRQCSITSFAVWVSAAINRDWKIYKNGTLMTGTPVLNTASGQAYDTYPMGTYPLAAGDRILVAYVALDGLPGANLAIAVVELTYD